MSITQFNKNTKSFKLKRRISYENQITFYHYFTIYPDI